MSTMLKTNRVTASEYLVYYAQDSIRYELIDGKLYAMTGTTGQHARIVGNLYSALHVHLKGKTCEPFMESLKVNVGEDFYYPDMVVDCGFDENNPLFAGEPILIVEVLSPSTRYKDLGTKLARYQQISTLQEYVVIEQDSMRLDIFRRQDEWLGTRYEKGDEVVLQSINLRLPIEEIYTRIIFIEPPVRMAKDIDE